MEVGITDYYDLREMFTEETPGMFIFESTVGGVQLNIALDAKRYMAESGDSMSKTLKTFSKSVQALCKDLIKE